MILDRLFGIEERATSGLTKPAGWLTDIFTGGKGLSGVSVTESTAMQLTAVSSAVNVISNGVASQSLKAHITKDDKVSVAKNHPVYKLLTLRPNPHMSAFTWKQLMEALALRWGNAYSWIEFNNAGYPRSIWPLNSAVAETLDKDGRLIVRTVIKNKQITIDYNEIIHIKALGSDGINGVSPIRQHAEELGIQIAAQNFGAEFFGNGATVQGLLKHPGKLSEDARAAIRDSWSNAFSGLGNRHKTAVLPDGMDYTRVGIPPEEAQFLETRKYGDTKIAQIYNVPPHMIGDLSKATFSNITEETMNFVRRTLTPWFVQWEQELTYKLFSENEQRRYSIEFDKTDILKGTPKDEAEKDVSLISGGIITRNEARKARGLNPIDGLDEILVPLNMVEMSQAKAAQEENEPIEEKSALDVMPLITRFSDLLTNAHKKVGNNGRIKRWLEGDAEKFINRHLTPITDSLGRDDIRSIFVAQYLDSVEKNCLVIESGLIENTLLELLADEH